MHQSNSIKKKRKSNHPGVNYARRESEDKLTGVEMRLEP